jgi:AraC family transcriptional regulator of adaptative response / DNA-3-methyladenine glycosylase II
MLMDAEACYRIIQARDARFDGAFFTAVTSTGIYCRPICPARTPKREKVKFYEYAASAEAAGFRPCKRCRPETAPGTPAWNGTSTTVNRALRLIENGFLDEKPVNQLAAVLGMGERHLRRLFIEHLGVGPSAVAQSRRVHFAARIVRETDLPVSHAALSAGFGSIRQFNDVFLKTFGAPPSSVRKPHKRSSDARPGRGSDGASRALTLTLSYRPPMQWKEMLSFFRKRAVRGVEIVTDRSYRRSLSVRGSIGMLEVSDSKSANSVDVSIEGIEPAGLGEVVRRVRRMFDLDADTHAIESHLLRDPLLAPIVAAAPGMRIPSTGDPFEAVVRAVLGQQISVAGAITLTGKLVERHGRPVEHGDGITRVFPGPSDLATADLTDMGIPGSRARTLAAVARAALEGSVNFDPGRSTDSIGQELEAVPGIGPWTVQYVALRGLGEPDAFPETDLVIRKALDALGYPKEKAARKEALSRLSPWRGYATLYLWKTMRGGSAK